ncbi:hypothetical protein DXA96_15740 [Lachnospiraceae bacterium OF09-33XD]|nr:hypothetical protein DXA96_15740 [Lachnospiraceae bacterium OF09-33XD]
MIQMEYNSGILRNHSVFTVIDLLFICVSQRLEFFHADYPITGWREFWAFMQSSPGYKEDSI